MNNGITIRRATPADAGLWAATRQKAWAATYRGIYPDSWIDQYNLAERTAGDRKKLSDPQVQSFLVMDGETCAGYFSYGPTPAGEFRLHSLYLLPAYQRQGLGRRIFCQLAADCRKEGFSGFYANCNYYNHPARGFYLRMGGKLTAIDGFYENKAQDQCQYDYDLTKGEQLWQKNLG